VKRKKRVMLKAKMKGKMNYLLAESVLINSVLQKKYIRKSGQEYKIINIVFSVKTATKTIIIISIVSFANRSTPITTKIKTMISG
jgi:hypothetical protein